MCKTEPSWAVDIHDTEVLEPVAEFLRTKHGIPAHVENTGGGCFCICVEQPPQEGEQDGLICLVTPEETDGRRWGVSLNVQGMDYIGSATTDVLTYDSFPTPEQAADAVAYWLKLMLPHMQSIHAVTEERITRALDDAEHNGFWPKIMEHFPEVQTGDFGPDEIFALEKALKQALETWLHWNHPTFQLDDLL